MLRYSCRNCYPSCRSLCVRVRNISSCRIVGNAAFNKRLINRAEDEVDVCIVGGGPAGLSAAIRLKQLEKENGRELRVVVLEKGSEVGTPPFNSLHRITSLKLAPRVPHCLWGSYRTQSTE